LYPKLIELLQNPAAQVSWSVIPAQTEAQSTVRICIDARRTRLCGWYRLKLKTPNTTMIRLVVGQASQPGPPTIACDELVRTGHIGGYIFVRKNVSRVELKIDFAAKKEVELGATLRPMPLIEQVWLALRAPLKKGLHAFYRVLRPKAEFRFDFKFGGFRDGQFSGSYDQWMRERENAAVSIVRQRLAVTHHEPPPVSILMPVCDPTPQHLRAAIQSVEAQTRGDWQLCIADDASNNPEIRQIIVSAL
jgi:hypothetical protein